MCVCVYVYLIYAKLAIQSIGEGMNFSRNSDGNNVSHFCLFLSKFYILVLVPCSLNYYDFIVCFANYCFFSKILCCSHVFILFDVISFS